jgi:hypothetical protein
VAGVQSGVGVLLLPAAFHNANEFVCDECLEGDHESCRRSGGWPFQETNERCGCHESDHRFDNRQ